MTTGDQHHGSPQGSGTVHGHAGTCPGCGAQVTFAVGSSRVAVCRYCSSLVARSGQNLALVGKVAELVPTGSRIALGARGAFLGEPFVVAGRSQMRWAQGVWDEWYIAFQSGRAGWLAEAQGRYYLTFEVPVHGPIPPANQVVPGLRVDFPGAGTFTVTDLKEAQRITCEGELPEMITIGEVHRSADLEAPNGAFATIDYGYARPGEVPEVFVGRQVTLEAIGLHGGAQGVQAAEAPEGMALRCANCGAPITRRVPDQTVRLACGSCGALLDTTQGALRVIEVLAQEARRPPIPLGTTGHLLGEERMVVGYMVRGCDIQGVHYTWEELLLYEPKTTAFSWLVLTDGHWSFVKPISAADVTDDPASATFAQCRYKLFSRYWGVVEYVLGEFYWQVAMGEGALLLDYVAPPFGLSVERTDSEVNWSHAQYLEVSEVAKAFARPELAQRRSSGVGSMQPWFLAAAWPTIRLWVSGGVAAAVLLLVVFLARGQHVIAEHTFQASEMTAVDPTSGDPADLPPGGRVLSYLSEPFELGGNSAVSVHVRSSVENSWAYVEGGLVEKDTGDAAVFGLETAYYHGYEDGESWSEGSTSASQDFSAPGKGTYIVRADLEWDPSQRVPPEVSLRVTEGGASVGQFLFVLFALLSPLLVLWNRRTFEARRWEESSLESSGQ